MLPAVSAPRTWGGRFELEAEAGTGGMGHVYRARDQRTGERVAIKVLHATEPGSIERFLRESALLRTIVHPGIVRLVDEGREPNGEAWLAMEWLDGEDLSHRLKRGPLGVPDTIVLARRLADALAAAHAAGIVHRDVKPANVFLPGGSVADAKLLDFGVAVRGLTSRVTRTGMLIGTPGYMAPEQARGDRVVDARADLFSLGAVIFEALVGRPAFEGAHVVAVLARILLEDAPRVREGLPDAPRWLDSLVAKLLTKEPELRLASASELRDAIDAELEAPSTARASTGSRGAVGTRERRVVSVVMAAPPTPGAARGDAPTLAALAGSAQMQALLDAIGAGDARAARLLDGSVVIVLTGGETAAELALRAVRSAAALQAATEIPRLVVSTGLVVSGERIPVGEAIDRAAGLLGDGEWQGIRFDEATAELTAENITTTQHGPVRLFAAEREGGDAMRSSGTRLPFTGREHELTLVEATFGACARGEGARAVLVTAAAGIGKSRLRRELVLRIAMSGANATLLLARADALGAGAPYALLGPALRRASGIQEDEPLEHQQAKLLEHVRRVMSDERAREIVPFLGELAAMPFEDAAIPALRAARARPELMADRIRDAWRSLIAAEAEAAPVLLVLEDLHRGDAASVHLVDHTLRSLPDARLMVLALGRPEVHERFPELWADRQPMELRLAPLGTRAAEKLVRAALGVRAPTELVDGVVGRAEGNPLFIEELVRSVSGRRDAALPTTVLATVQARLDALDARTRRVLRAASVLGATFWLGAVASLLGEGEDADGAGAGTEAPAGAPPVEDAVTALVQHGFVERRARSAFAGQVELRFRHDLVRDAAYVSLPEEDRTLAHQLAAEWLVAHGERNALTLAEHFLRAQDPARAVRYFAEAVRQAIDAVDLAGALDLAARGIALATEPLDRAAFEMARAVAHRWRSEHAAAIDAARRTCDASTPADDVWWRAMSELTLSAGRLGRIDELQNAIARIEAHLDTSKATASARAEAALGASGQLIHVGRLDAGRAFLARAEPLAVESDDPLVLGRVATLRGLLATADGHWDESVIHYQRARELYLSIHDSRDEASSTINLGAALCSIGEPEEAAVVLREGLELGERLALPYVESFARLNLGWALLEMGEDARAGLELERVVSSTSAGDPTRLRCFAFLYLAFAYRQLGRVDDAERQAALAFAQSGPFPHVKAQALTELAEVSLARGDAARALEQARTGVEIADGLGRLDEHDLSLRCAYVRALVATGAHEEARAVMVRALDRLAREAARMREGPTRAKFLSTREALRARGLGRELGIPT